MPRVEWDYILNADDLIVGNKRAEESARNVDVAMNGVASSGAGAAAAMGRTGASASAMREQIQQNRTAMVGLDSEIAGVKSQLAALDNEIAKSVAAIGEEAAETRELIKDAAMLKGELRELQAQKASVSAATNVLKNDLAATGEKTISGAGALRLMGAESKFLGESMGFAVRPAAMLLNAFQTLNPVVLIATLGVGLLIEQFAKFFKTGSDNVKLSKELIETDATLAGVFANLARSGDDVDGALARQSERYKAVLKSDISALLTTYVTQYHKLAAAQDEAKRSDEAALASQLAYNDALERNKQIAGGTLPLTGEITVMQKHYADATENATDKQHEQAKAVEGTVAALAAAYHAGVISEQEMYALAKSDYADADALAHLRGELDKYVSAEERFLEALKKQGAGFSTQATQAGLVQQIIDVGANLDAVLKMPGETMRTAALSQKGALEQIKKTLEETTLSQSGYNAAVAGLPQLIRDALAEIDKVDKGMKIFTDHTKQQEAAARSLTKTTAELTAELEKANAAAEGGKTFDVQVEQMQAAMNKKREMLIADHQLTAQNEATLTALTLANITKINNEHVKAREAAALRIESINQKAIVDDYERHKAAITTQTAEDRKFFVGLGLNEVEVYTLTIRAKQARTDEFMRWFIGENEKMYREMDRVAQHHDQQENAERAKSAEIAFKESLRGFEEHEKQIQALISRFSRSKGSTGILDINELEDANKELQRLGLTIQAVDGRFGGSARNLEQFRLRMKAIELIAQGHPFKALAIEAQQLSIQMRESQTDAERWSSFLTNAVNQMGSSIEQGFEGLVNGTTTFAQLMKKIIFDLIASLAEQWGAYYLAIGIADLFWNPAKGAAELAAGAALMALAGVLHALGGSGSKSSTAATGGGASSGGAGSTSQRQGVPPTLINFPTSPQSQPIVIQLDRNLSNDLIKGKKVLTANNIRQPEYAGMLKQVTGPKK